MGYAETMRNRKAATYSAIVAATLTIGTLEIASAQAQNIPGDSPYLQSIFAFASYLCVREFYEPGNKKLAKEFSALMRESMKLEVSDYNKAMRTEGFVDDVKTWMKNNPSKYCAEAKYIFTKGRHLLNSSTKSEEVSTSAHEKCLNAKDYEGCIRVVESANSSPTKNKDCKPDGRCVVRTPGTDVFGMKQPLGWLYYETDDGTRVNYFSPTVYRVPHNKQEHRYLARTEIVRYYQNPKEGSSGSFIGGGSASTSCVDYGGSFSCSTTSSPSTYIPGRSATPGGVRSKRFTRVVDCKDKTYASYKRIDESKTSYGWHPASESSWSMEIIDEFCSKARTLPPLKMKL